MNSLLDKEQQGFQTLKGHLETTFSQVSLFYCLCNRNVFTVTEHSHGKLDTYHSNGHVPGSREGEGASDWRLHVARYPRTPEVWCSVCPTHAHAET